MKILSPLLKVENEENATHKDTKPDKILEYRLLWFCVFLCFSALVAKSELSERIQNIGTNYVT